MLLPTDDATPATIKRFQEIVDGLMWLLRTRIDIQFTVNLLARFLKNATQAHIDIALGRPMNYLAGTVCFREASACHHGPSGVPLTLPSTLVNLKKWGVCYNSTSQRRWVCENTFSFILIV